MEKNTKHLQIRKITESRIAQLADEKTGQFLSKMSDEDWVQVIHLTSSGAYQHVIAEHFGINAATILKKCERDTVFRDLYNDARIMSALQWCDDNIATAAGVDGYTTGDVRRDELLIKTRLDWAKRLAPQLLGDKMQVDQNITININPDHLDW